MPVKPRGTATRAFLIPARLVQYRGAERMSRRELAGTIGLSERTVEAWETGTRRPRPDSIEALATALGCTVDDLTGGTE